MYPYRTPIENQYPDSGQSQRGSGSQKYLRANHQNKSRDFASVYYAYGKSAAVEFACDETKKQRINTITLHAASARQDEPHGYDWNNKTTIQLPRNELLSMAAVMLGLLPKSEFKHHSAYGSKSYSLEHQREKIFVMVAEKGKPIRAVALSPEDTFQVISLVFRQIKANAQWLSVIEIMQLIELTVVKMKLARMGEDGEIRSSAHTHDDDDEYYDDDEINEQEENYNVIDPNAAKEASIVDDDEDEVGDGDALNTR
ncbi:MAG: hypothetical protein ACFCUJ_12765 [Thiotrichales bacterium]